MMTRKLVAMLEIACGLVLVFASIHLWLALMIVAILPVMLLAQLSKSLAEGVLVGLIRLEAWVLRHSVSSFFSPGLRHLQPNADELLAADTRPPVVFLRSFRDESITEHSELGTSTVAEDIYAHWMPHFFHRYLPKGRAESDLSLILKALGPVVAIGRPGEKLQLLGASRAYCSDDQWQETVSSWIRRSRVTVLMIDSLPRGGTEWELLHARQTLHPDRFVLFFPGTIQQRELHFAANREHLAAIIQRPMPPAMVVSQFICFSQDWTPRILNNTNDLMEHLDPGFKTPPPWTTFGWPRLAIFASIVTGFGLEIAYLGYKGYELLK